MLEPYAFADLLEYFSHRSFGALGLLEERSYFSGGGQKVFDEKISIGDDSLDPRGLRRRSTSRGSRSSACNWSRTASRAEVVWDRTTAAQRATAPSRRVTHRRAIHAIGGLCRTRAGRAGGAESIDELAEQVGDGIYITRLHYLGVVHPREGVVMGMTRDGTFRIRGGKIAERWSTFASPSRCRTSYETCSV